MHNLEESAKTIPEEREKNILEELEKELLGNMKVFIGKLFYETPATDNPPTYINPNVVTEVYISQTGEVYVRNQQGTLYIFENITFLKKIA